MVAPVEPEIRSWRAGLWNERSIPFHLWPPWIITRAIREFMPDVVDVHEETYWPSGAEAAWLAKRHPLVMYSAQNLVKSLPWPIAAMQRRVLRDVKACYPRVLRARGFRGLIEVIPLGVEDELFDITPSGDRIGFIGSLTEQKGVDDLLCYGSRLLAIGDGPMAKLLRDAGCEVRVAKSLPALASCLAEMAVLVAPSRTMPTLREQFGRMAVEAMAAGVPVIVSASGALPEVVGDAGIVVPERDPEALHAAVARVLADPADLSERGRRRARERFRWDVIAEQLERVYEVAVA
jgi:glycosyltransferase involved in cell wall biosynthesis